MYKTKNVFNLIFPNKEELIKKISILMTSIFIVAFILFLTSTHLFLPKKQFGKNIVIHITSNHNGSKIALTSKNKTKTNKWNLYISQKNLEFLPFNPNSDITFAGDFLFGNEQNTFFYTASQDKKFSLWKGNFLIEKSEKIFDLEQHISFPYPLNNGDVYFISKNITIKDKAGWDWFLFSPKNGIKKITNNNYYYFKKPFFLSDSILGFTQEHTFAKLGNAEDPRLGKMYLETLIINKNTEAENMLNELNKYLSSSNSKSEPSIQCNENSTICVINNTSTLENSITFKHDFFMIEASGSKKLDIRLSWGESFSLSGDGKHLFIVGTHGARSEEYFLHKYSRNKNGDFLFIEEKEVNFIKN